MPKVSFVLPAFKRRFLHEAIESILAQTYRDFELVVVDDCSPEDLKSVVDKFYDERLTYHRNKANIGGNDLVAAWNRAMEFARGEWCVLASDDDVYEPGYLAELITLVGKYPSCNLFHCKVGCIDEKGRLTRIGNGRAEYEDVFQFVNQVLRIGSLQAAPDFMFRLRALRNAGGFVAFPVAWGTDDATWIKLARHGGCVCSPRMLFRFRMSGINISSRNDNAVAKIIARARFEEWFSDFLKTLHPKTEEQHCIFEQSKSFVWSSYCLPMIRRMALSIGILDELRFLIHAKLPTHIRSELWNGFCRKIVKRILHPWRA